ncbi:MAG TPA: hypothetical protein PK970_07905, partial [Hyphomicrobiaceae bacterium]|nr:hypothetical protein [Hyphomicrobiaceae bacterium]
MPRTEPGTRSTALPTLSKSLLRRLADLARPEAVAFERKPDGGALIRLRPGPRARKAEPQRLDAHELARLAADGWIDLVKETAADSGRIWRLTDIGRARLREAVLSRSPPKPASRRRTSRRAATADT